MATSTPGVRDIRRSITADTPPPYPPGSWRPSRRSYRHASPSPSRSGDDQLLYKLTPRSAVEMFRSPPPPLKTALDGAAAVDQNFAYRAAVASRKIQEWLDELSGWYWPTVGTSSGFEFTRPKRRRLVMPDSPSLHVAKNRRQPSQEREPIVLTDSEDEDTSYRGCLLESQVEAYEKRVDEIDRDMKELDLEDIKRHVLQNHIMPLSRPGTPFSDTRSTVSSVSISKMDDITAVLTAIVMQALPNLSRLTRLLNIWITRLAVLNGMPGFLTALEDAEIALRSAWDVLSSDPPKQGKTEAITKDDFQTIQKVVVPRVSRAGHKLDALLDTLEGMNDTLPESWIDRMDAVERGSQEWVATCEQKIRESEWAKIFEASKNILKPSRTPSVATTIAISEREDESHKSTPDSMSSSSVIDDQEGPKKTRPEHLPEIEVSNHPEGDSSPVGPATPVETNEYAVDDSFISEILAYDKDLAILEEEDEEQLLPDLRRDSEVSHASTIIHNKHPFASEVFQREATPEMARRHPTDDRFVDDFSSPPSSPPIIRKTKKFATRTKAGSRPRTPFEGPGDFIEETSASSSPRRQLDGNSDAHLQQQISEILESIPAKIRLAPEPASAATLNPPDLPIQRLKQRKPDNQTPSTRTTSSLSSRAGTPSFTLAPAYARTGNSRPARAPRNPEIKLYHLQRSTGEAPIKLFIRCVGENGERVMVRVGGGWADLGEYLKDYAAHHRRTATAESAAKVEVRGVNDASGNRPPSRAVGSSPPSRPGSAMAPSSPITPLMVRKTRRSQGASERPQRAPLAVSDPNAPIITGGGSSSSRPGSIRSRSSSWSDEDSSLGLAGPTGKRIDMTEENRAWVESVKEQVRMVSGERKFSSTSAVNEERKPAVPNSRSKSSMENRFGEMGKVGATKRLYRKRGSVGN